MVGIFFFLTLEYLQQISHIVHISPQVRDVAVNVQKPVSHNTNVIQFVPYTWLPARSLENVYNSNTTHSLLQSSTDLILITAP